MKLFRIILITLSLMPSLAQGSEQQRILAMTPHACEMLYAIGAESQLVGAVAYCDYPEEAKKHPRVGSYERINVEASLRLKPDVAIVMSRNVIGVERLQQMGVDIVVSNPNSFESMFHDIQKLGELTGHVQQSETLVRKLRERLRRVRSAVDSATPVFFELWPDPMLTAGGPSFITDVIREAGGRNVFSQIEMETAHVNIEAVIRARPEVIVIPEEKRDIAERQAFWERWLGRGSVRFVVIDPDLLHRPGPRLLDGVEQLQQALQGGQDGT
ncbi:MAG: cobalamin-binding protein [Mariprofundaceae bacterium]